MDHLFSLHSGVEDLTLIESIKKYFSELSLTIDKFNATYFNNSIHIINDKGIFKSLITNNKYVELSTIQIPTPVFFNPKLISWEEYVTVCLEAAGLIKFAQIETDRIYKTYKHALVKNEVPYAIRTWDYTKTIGELKQKMDLMFEQSKVSSQPVNVLYKNFTQAEHLIVKFNKTVSGIKSRDVEVLSKSVDGVVDLLKLMQTKIANDDWTISKEQIDTIEMSANRLKDLIIFTGRLMGLLNELTRVIELQVDALRNHK